MDNQHRKIAGYRELSQEEIDLMNRIKAKGGELLQLVAELKQHINREHSKRVQAVSRSQTVEEAQSTNAELDRFNDAEPARWCSIGKTDIQTGIMALVRAVAQPAGV